MYVYGKHFKVYTDHKPLRTFMTTETKSLRLARWLDRIAMYDCEIIYKKGNANGDADALSRIATEEIPADIANRNENKDVIINGSVVLEDRQGL